MEKARENIDKKVLYFQYGGSLSLSANLANQLIYEFPEKIIVYENSKSAIHELKLANDTLELLKENSEPNVKSIVDERFLENPTIIINEITFNKVNKFIVYPVEISKGRIVKTYESFIKRL
jgi:hypothetical protein